MKPINIFFILSFLMNVNSNLYSQIPGCTDPQAINYNEDAEINDGTCSYPPTSYTPLLITDLIDSLNEVSGIIQYDSFLVTHNDSGSEPILYFLNKTNGNIVHTKFINNAENIDWESITQDSQYVYIGDFGNNYGNRTNLHVLKISKTDLNSLDTVPSEIIYFTYPDQLTLDDSLNGTEYDCEAFITLGDSLYLFTKNWISQTTRMYSIPKVPGNHIAISRENFNTDGLITDATIDSTGSYITLLGYKRNALGLYQIFTWLLYDYSKPNFLDGNKRRIDLGTALNLGQCEGITLISQNVGYIISEAISISSLGINIPAKLHQFNFSHLLSPPSIIPSFNNLQDFKIFPNPTYNEIFINTYHLNHRNFTIYNSTGQIIKKGTIAGNKINTSDIQNGIYYIIIDKHYRFKFTKTS